jgi:hypothetical protein
MGQPLPVKAHPEAAAPDKPAVLGDGPEVLPCFHERCLLQVFIYYSRFRMGLQGKDHCFPTAPKPENSDGAKFK